jgi:hypothetical protein
VIGLAIGLILAPLLARKFKDMSPAEVITYLFDAVKNVLDIFVKVITWIIGLVKK